MHDKLPNVIAAAVGGMHAWGIAQRFEGHENRETLPVLRAGHSAVLIWPFTTDRYPNARFTARFTDDAGLRWQIDNDLHLEKRASCDW